MTPKKASPEASAGDTAEHQLRALGVRGVLVQMAQRGKIIDVRMFSTGRRSTSTSGRSVLTRGARPTSGRRASATSVANTSRLKSWKPTTSLRGTRAGRPRLPTARCSAWTTTVGRAASDRGARAAIAPCGHLSRRLAVTPLRSLLAREPVVSMKTSPVDLPGSRRGPDAIQPPENRSTMRGFAPRQAVS